MKRRDLLKALPAIATIPASASFFAIPNDRKVIAFVDATAELLLDVVRKIKLPAEVTIVPVRIPEGKTIDDVIRLYETH